MRMIHGFNTPLFGLVPKVMALALSTPVSTSTGNVPNSVVDGSLCSPSAKRHLIMTPQDRIPPQNVTDSNAQCGEPLRKIAKKSLETPQHLTRALVSCPEGLPMVQCVFIIFYEMYFLTSTLYA